MLLGLALTGPFGTHSYGSKGSSRGQDPVLAAAISHREAVRMEGWGCWGQTAGGEKLVFLSVF